jgi:hypothetical protein
MKVEEVILLKKATALNSIRRMYHPKAKPLTCCYEEGETQSGRRDEVVQRIINQLEKELFELKH